jgi:hypothetical protein
MNYATHTIESSLDQSSYSGYLSQPQLIKIINNNKFQTQFDISIVERITYDSDINIHIMTIDMNSSPTIYPTSLNSTITTNKTDHLLVTIENQYPHLKISNITIDGTINTIVKNIWYNTSPIQFNQQGQIDITVLSSQNQTYTGFLNVTCTSSRTGKTNYSIPIMIHSENSPPDIIYIKGSFFGNETAPTVNISSIVMDNNIVSDVTCCVLKPDGSEQNKSMVQLHDQGYYFMNSTFDEPGEYTYYIWANNKLNQSIASPVFSFTVPNQPVKASPGFELLFFILALAFLYVWNRKKNK